MSFAKDTFVPVFGKPQPSVPNAIHFKTGGAEGAWELVVADTGAGYFMNRFLYLFGAGLERLVPCLDAWSFVVPASRDRIVLGRNAYGSLLVLENASAELGGGRVYLLDPFRIAYTSAGGFDQLSLISVGLTENRIPNFLDTKLYEVWMKKRKAPFEDGMILAPKTPYGLGGTMSPGNFQEEEIVSFYESSGPIFAKAFAKMGKPPPKPIKF